MLVEGFKRETHPKLEVFRAVVGKPMLHPDDPNIVAVASDGAVAARVPVVLARRYRGGGGYSRWPRRCRSMPHSRAERLMAQLTDDCFAFGGPLLAIDDVERLIGERVTPVAETETVALREARGRVLAADVLAPIDLPPFDNSAVDGYAVRHADVGKDETKLAIVDRLTAGRAAAREIGAGEAIRIFTGAPMPQGADTVFMQEDVRVDERAVFVPPGLKRGANRRLAGEDVARGSVALRAGRRLQPQDLSMAAALGLQRWPCGGACASRSSRPATRSSSPAHRCPPPGSTTRTANCCAGCWRGSTPRSAISASCATIPTSLRARLDRGGAGP